MKTDSICPGYICTICLLCCIDLLGMPSRPFMSYLVDLLLSFCIKQITRVLLFDFGLFAVYPIYIIYLSILLLSLGLDFVTAHCGHLCCCSALLCFACWVCLYIFYIYIFIFWGGFIMIML